MRPLQRERIIGAVPGNQGTVGAQELRSLIRPQGLTAAFPLMKRTHRTAVERIDERLKRFGFSLPVIDGGFPYADVMAFRSNVYLTANDSGAVDKPNRSTAGNHSFQSAFVHMEDGLVFEAGQNLDKRTDMGLGRWKFQLRKR